MTPLEPEWSVVHLEARQAETQVQNAAPRP